MDPAALNFEPRANINSRSWCIPYAAGCMMPAAAAAGSGYSNPSSHKRQGLAANFDPLATVHSSSSCTVEYLGCTHTAALNYDPLATVEHDCWFSKAGCLDPAALNFGCPLPGTAACSILTGPDRITVHVAGLCSFEVPAPPTPPQPGLPVGASKEPSEYRAVIGFRRRAPYTYPEEVVLREAIGARYEKAASRVLVEQGGASEVGVQDGRRRLSVVGVEVIALCDGADDMAATAARQRADMASFEAAQMLLGEDLLELPTVREVIIYRYTPAPWPMPPPSPPSPPSMPRRMIGSIPEGLFIQIVAFSVVGLMLLGAIIACGVWLRRNRRASRYGVAPAYETGNVLATKNEL